MTSLCRLFILTLLLFLPEPETQGQVLNHGSRHERNIALTFDACPSSTHGGFDARIIQTLADSGVPATLFLSGKWIQKHTREVKKLASMPQFEIGNLSYSHPHCTTLSDDSVTHELEQTESLLQRLIGTSAKLFRPSYGETNRRIDSLAQKIGLTTVNFDLASGDPDSSLSRDRIIHYVVSSARNGSIIVMHMNGRGWHTSEALPLIIQGLRSKAFIFSHVSDLLRMQNASARKQ